MNGQGVDRDHQGEQDLVVVTLRGVQRFIAESRSTADLHAGSALMSELASAMVKAAKNFEPRAELIMPAEAARESVPNRLAVRIAAGHGRHLAKRMADEAHATWRTRECSIQSTSSNEAAGADEPGTEVTPGFPDIQWVVVGPDPRGYASQWDRASRALAARKRINSFTFPPVDQVRICSLTGRWTARDSGPKGAWNVRVGEALSVPGHVKRAFSRDPRQQRFPSTWTIASAPYRSAIIERAANDDELRSAVGELRVAVETLLSECDEKDRDKLKRRSAVVPGIVRSDNEDLDWLRTIEGAWCSPWTWEPAALRRDNELDNLPDADYCGLIREAAADLVKKAAESPDLPPLTGYLAVIAQDADHMGTRLSEFPDRADLVEWHRNVSAALAEAGRRQRQAVEVRGMFARVVYAGGDDLLALAPAATALAVARTASSVFYDVVAGKFEDPATASTAIVCFDASWPLQSAISAVQTLLKEAKDNHRPGLGVAVLRGGGERNRLVVPWADRGGNPMIGHLETLAESMATASEGLSGQLASELERDADALATLGRDWLRLELARRCARHGGGAAADALLALSHEDSGGRLTVPDQAVTIARFLAGEVGTADPALIASSAS